MEQQNGHSNYQFNKMAPIDEKQRLQHLDSLRGLALFGILIVNMLSFQYGTVGYEFIYQDLPWLDQMIHTIIQWLFQGSFYPVFSILFGFGAVIIYERAVKREHSFKRLYSRRLMILLLLGFVHLYFIWDGDILLNYAITGAVFMFFIHHRKKTLLTFAIILAILINLPGLIPGGEEDDQPPYLAYVQLEEEVLTEGSYVDVVNHRFMESPYDYLYFGDDIDPVEKNFIATFSYIFSFILMVTQTLMLFFIGGALAKSRWLHEPFEYLHKLKKTAIYFLISGLILKGSMVMFGNAILEYIGYFLGGPLLAIGYISLFTLIFIKKKDTKITRSFAYAGRMALTNYIVQSLVMTTIFYGYGFGLFGKLGILGGALLSLFLFVIQAIYSKWWLARFHFGPLELILRSGMYLKRQKFKREISQP